MLLVMATEPDDKTLMIRYRKGDETAFELLYSRHRGPLYRYFLRHGVDRETAAELFQEVWAKVIQARKRYEPTAKFTTFMYTLAHNVRVDHHRRAGRRPDLAAVSNDPELITAPTRGNPDSVVEVSATMRRFRAALDQLPSDQRDAFLLREEGGLSLADIAGATGVSAETAKSRLRYAVRKLRDALGAENGGDSHD